MTFRWLIVLTIYTLLIGPMMDVPSTGAKAKSRTQTTRTASER